MFKKYRFTTRTFVLVLSLFASPCTLLAEIVDYDYFEKLIQQKQPDTGVYVLEKGEESLFSRAWLTDNARKTIEVQYFIWSTDNIGILASEALLRAAERGIKIRVIVDDLLIDWPDKTLLALALHPNIDIKIYNPKHSVGTPLHKRIYNFFRDFRGFNQRMHDKTFIVDGIAAITGGRNMADEYYDYNHKYNFRDRDVLLLGGAVNDITKNFNRFWNHSLSVPVEELYDGFGIMQENVDVNAEEIQKIYNDMHNYAKLPENFEPHIKQRIHDLTLSFPTLLKNIRWSDVEIIYDFPGKNNNSILLGGGSNSTSRLATFAKTAQKSILIQSPYAVVTEETRDLFESLIKKGVEIKISTNSLASTDNVPAFSGYKNQREILLEMGIDIYEYRRYPKIQSSLMQRFEENKDEIPVFALHAKSMVVDNEAVYIGTFNLDPRSVNLNTETGAIIYDKDIAQRVTDQINTDIHPDNSWNAKRKYPDNNNSLWKQIQLLFWQSMPIQPLL